MEPKEQPNAPYAPKGAVLKCIDYIRGPGLGGIVTWRALVGIGVAEGSAPRALAALKYLGFLDADGRTTMTCREMARVPAKDYRKLLGRVVRRSYSEILKSVDPRNATSSTLEEAFRGQEPYKKRKEMITLFAALCRESDINPGSPPSRNGRGFGPQDGYASLQTIIPGSNGVLQELNSQVLLGLVRDLPVEGRWTQTEKDTWLMAFTAVLDLYVKLVPDVSKETTPSDIVAEPQIEEQAS